MLKRHLIEKLLKNGWTEVQSDWEYRKGNWGAFRDTSSWWQISTTERTLVFEVHEPEQYEAHWTANMIEHMCSINDDRMRLRKSLENLRNVTQEIEVKKIVAENLAECYHTWLVLENELRCSICNATKAK